jgi:glutamyl-tRNA reductase
LNLLLVGMSHRTAPVDIRERYTVRPEQLRAVDEKLVREPGCDEAVLISTCNRIEVVVVSRELRDAAERVHAFLGNEIGDGSAEPGQLYELRDADAAKHVFRIASSLDSMVLGEAQILGQIKEAYRQAAAAGSVGPILHRLFERAFRTAKRVRNETGLGASVVSIARVGVQLAAEVFEDLDTKRVLLVGAGEMAESALQGLREVGARDIAVANRTVESAQELASRFAARALGLDSLEAELTAADIAVVSVASDRPLIASELLARCMARRVGRPLLMMDLGVPRNVDPRASALDDLYLYDLDDLDEVSARGRARRREAVDPAEAIVAEEVSRYERWRAGLDAVPVIRELRDRVLELVRVEAQRGARRHPDSPEFLEALERALENVAKKLLHRSFERLRAEAEEDGSPYYADAVREIFGLAEEDE